MLHGKKLARDRCAGCLPVNDFIDRRAMPSELRLRWDRHWDEAAVQWTDRLMNIADEALGLE